MKDTKTLLRTFKYWTNKKGNQQQILHPQQQHLPLLPPFVVHRATNHNPAVDIHFENARAAARCNIATKSASERIGVQEGTNKNAIRERLRKKKEAKKEAKKGGSSSQNKTSKST
jgi:hypothetical protein